MSGMDEQGIGSTSKQIIGPSWDDIIEERMKWSVGYLECSACGSKIYQVVPFNWRSFEENNAVFEKLKRMYLERWRKVYDGVKLYHSGHATQCRGLFSFVEYSEE